MLSFTARVSSLCLLIGCTFAATTPSALAQNGTWSGAGLDILWSNPANWVNNTPPTSGGTVTFNASSNSNITTFNDNVGLSLGGIVNGPVPSAGPVTINGNSFSVGASGINMTTATQDLTINLGANDLANSTSDQWTMLNGRSMTVIANHIFLSNTTASNTLTLSMQTLTGSLVLNAIIADSSAAGASSSGLSFTSANTGTTTATVQLLQPNTYTGPTSLASRGTTYQIGSNSPFGTGPVTITILGIVPQIQAFGADRTIGNDITLNGGFLLGGTNNLTFNGTINVPVSRAITTQMAVGTTATFNGPVIVTTGTLTAGLPGTPAAAGTVAFNGVISGAGSLLLPGNGNGAAIIDLVQLNAQNTYTGGTTLSGQGATALVGSSSVLNAGTIVSGPFGTGNVIANNTNSAPRLQSVNGSQSVANNITLTSNLTVQGSLDLTLAGVLSSVGGVNKNGTGNLFLTNANTYSGNTNVTAGRLMASNSTGSATGSGTVTVAGTGPAGSGGTLVGTGFINGAIVLSATALATQGGTLSPGNGIGTLTNTGGTTVVHPVATFVFEHSAAVAGPNAPIGGTTADLYAGTGAANLDFSLLGTTAGQQFNLVLQPVVYPAILPTQPVTYTIADFSTSTSATPIIAPAGVAGNDLTPFFNVTGGFQPTLTPVVTLNNGNQVQVTFIPVPEPTCILAACCGLTALAAWRRSRRAI